MGANAQTSVPAFTAGQVLTAAQMTQVNTGIPVFASSTERDAAFGGAGEKTLAEGQFAYLEDTDAVQVYDGSAWQTVGAATVKKVDRFTASGTWTVPTGVTYAIAHILGGGGGGGGQYNAGSAGGDSSVAFAGGTVTGLGGQGGMRAYSTNSRAATNQAANSGRGGMGNYEVYGNSKGFDAQWIVAGDDVTPGASITVTVGAAGAGAGTGATAGGDGGSGYVWIEYQEPA